jgi:hypothetical protein
MPPSAPQRGPVLIIQAWPPYGSSCMTNSIRTSCMAISRQLTWPEPNYRGHFSDLCQKKCACNQVWKNLCIWQYKFWTSGRRAARRSEASEGVSHSSSRSGEESCVEELFIWNCLPSTIVLIVTVPCPPRLRSVCTIRVHSRSFFPNLLVACGVSAPLSIMARYNYVYYYYYYYYRRYYVYY